MLCFIVNMLTSRRCFPQCHKRVAALQLLLCIRKRVPDQLQHIAVDCLAATNGADTAQPVITGTGTQETSFNIQAEIQSAGPERQQGHHT